MAYYLDKGTNNTAWVDRYFNVGFSGVLVTIISVVAKVLKKYDLPINEYGIDYNFYIKECNKIIDAIGDMYTAGGMVCGCLESYKGSHALNNIVLRKLFSNPDNYDIIDG